MNKKKKKNYITLICFTNQEKLLLSFMMVILQLCLNHSTNQLKEQDLKYQLLNEWFKDYQ